LKVSLDLFPQIIVQFRLISTKKLSKTQYLRRVNENKVEPWKKLPQNKSSIQRSLALP
jgi:hypothetical protein